MNERLTTMDTAGNWTAPEADDDGEIAPLTPERIERLKESPRIKIIRRALRLSQEEFAARYRIPVGTRHRPRTRHGPAGFERAVKIIPS